MLREKFHSQIQALLTPLIEFLNQKGITPNQLTVTGLALNFIAGLIYASGNFILGGLMVIVAAMGDMLDGPLARVTGKTTPFGAFLDSTVDRYSDFFIFGGAAFYFAKAGVWDFFILALGILAGSFVTSYSKARAENLIKNCSVGFFERAERIILFITGSILPFLLPLILWVLFIGTNATALQRILFTRKALTEKQ